MLGRSMFGRKRRDNVIWKIRVCNSQEKKERESNRRREKLRYFFCHFKKEDRD